MVRRLIVDTGVLVATERQRRSLLNVIAEDDDVVISAITVAELQAGVELADEEHRPAREEYVAGVVASIPIEPYGSRTALAHAHLLAATRRSGRPRGAHDLIVAATAVATGRTVITTDRRAGFAELPGVESLVV